jgi:anti-sigma-K factor RskA
LETEQVASLSADALKARALMETLTASNTLRVTLNTTPGAKPAPQGRASYLASKGTLVFIANNLEPLPLDKVYELWIIPADGTAPVPAGTFHPDAHGNASVVMPKIPTGVPAKAFGVTMEAEGGSAKPTLPILMVGQ